LRDIAQAAQRSILQLTGQERFQLTRQERFYKDKTVMQTSGPIGAEDGLWNEMQWRRRETYTSTTDVFDPLPARTECRQLYRLLNQTFQVASYSYHFSLSLQQSTNLDIFNQDKDRTQLVSDQSVVEDIYFLP